MPSRELDEPRARTLLREACRVAAISPERERLIRIGSNAIFRLADPVVVRISRHGADIESARRTVQAARWLESAGYPAVRVFNVAAGQPVIVEGHAITFWRPVSDGRDTYASTSQLAELLAQLHRLTPPGAVGLSELQPFENAERRISANEWLTPHDRRYLSGLFEDLRDAYAELKFVLPRGVIHGDANVGNVLLDFDGKPVVIDLDGFAIGPREWDLALTAIYYESFGWHTREEYEMFARGYGVDIMDWSGYPVMRAVREFLMVTWI